MGNDGNEREFLVRMDRRGRGWDFAQKFHTSGGIRRGG